MSDGCRVRVTGPLALYADGFRQDLAVQGYKVQPRDRNLRTLAHVSRWMASRGLSVGELTPGRLEEFLEARRPRGLSPCTIGTSSDAADGVPARLGGGAASWCLGHRQGGSGGGGVSSLPPQRAGVDARRGGQVPRLGREFLASCKHSGVLELSELSAASVTEYVVRGCRGRTGASAGHLVTGLRSLLGFLFLAGHTSGQLASAVPTVAHWGAGSLPRALGPGAVALLVASCDTETLVSRRTGRSSSCSPGSACGLAKWPHWSWATSIGGRASSWFTTARPVATSGSLYPWMLGRPWSVTSAEVDHGSHAGRCSYGSTPRSWA